MIAQKLQQDTVLLRKQLEWLEYSYDECREIGIKQEYTVEEFGRFETLCSRYSRGIDFLIRKAFRTIDAYEFENQGTLIDTVNHAHKRGLIESVERIRIMKDIRNTITHEYIEEALSEVFDEVLDATGTLTGMIQKTLDYMEKLTNPKP